MSKRKAFLLVTAGLVAGLVVGSVGVSYAVTETSSTGPLVGTGVRMGQAIRDAGARLVDVLADLTGLSTDEIQAQRAEGESIADIAEANGVDSDDVVSAALDARKELLDARVADGTITQEQADLAYETMSGRLAERVTTDATGAPAWSGKGGGMGGGRGGGMGGGMGLRDGSCAATQ